jgi:hypothetical protein
MVDDADHAGGAGDLVTRHFEGVASQWPWSIAAEKSGITIGYLDRIVCQVDFPPELDLVPRTQLARAPEFILGHEEQRLRGPAPLDFDRAEGRECMVLDVPSE